jgi:exodeoxyribonuclease VII small subunit
MAENTQVDVRKLSFERAMEELESIVTRLEGGKVPLEESVTIYERGESLKRRCEELLRQAEARVDRITTDADGQAVGTAPLDVQCRPAAAGAAARRSPATGENISRIRRETPRTGSRNSSWRVTRPVIVPAVRPGDHC